MPRQAQPMTTVRVRRSKFSFNEKQCAWRFPSIDLYFLSIAIAEVREYLDGLRPAEDAIVDDDTSYSATLAVSDDPSAHVKQSDVSDIKPNVGDGRDFERWLFADWLNKPYKKGGRQKEPALPILKQAKWNSGDNPVLVTAAIMMLGVVLASITERIAT
ncbi:hypothetical protein ACHAW5_006505 [Stephanodiscus triporus]|uniref:Uncharacterized protein n=1 Tax=Stephanodiscus triporus TaxID=2934178 RepID=A0ABD3NHH5_9STRA